MLHRICKADGITAVVSLHQVEFARRYADRIVGLARGAVVFDGPPASSDGRSHRPDLRRAAPPRSAARRSRPSNAEQETYA